ncbi:hypothetical protein LXA43DRAFT_478816 [Ganoderma leucocontextum]|nr:hypothetical protein LXA43DRAFT_478816 [Ganoderma leucocontextum]
MRTRPLLSLRFFLSRHVHTAASPPPALSLRPFRPSRSPPRSQWPLSRTHRTPPPGPDHSPSRPCGSYVICARLSRASRPVFSSSPRFPLPQHPPAVSNPPALIRASPPPLHSVHVHLALPSSPHPSIHPAVGPPHGAPSLLPPAIPPGSSVASWPPATLIFSPLRPRSKPHTALSCARHAHLSSSSLSRVHILRPLN